MAAVYSEIPNELRAATKYVAGHTDQARLVFPIWRPSTKQGLLLRLVIGLWLTLTLTILLILAVSRTETPVPVVAIPDYLLPGRSLPEVVSCVSGDAGFRYMSYCTVFQEGLGKVYLTYDQRTQVIRNVGLVVAANTIGDFMLARGNPDSYRYDNGLYQIYWGTMSASVWAPLDPGSRIRAIHYDLESSDLPQGRLAWRGFVTISSNTNGQTKTDS